MTSHCPQQWSSSLLFVLTNVSTTDAQTVLSHTHLNFLLKLHYSPAIHWIIFVLVLICFTRKSMVKWAAQLLHIVCDGIFECWLGGWCKGAVGNAWHRTQGITGAEPQIRLDNQLNTNAKTYLGICVTSYSCKRCMSCVFLPPHVREWVLHSSFNLWTLRLALCLK